MRGFIIQNNFSDSPDPLYVCLILDVCGGSLISKLLVASAYHCMELKESCKYRYKQKCKKNGRKTNKQCKEHAKKECEGKSKWLSFYPPKLCEPSNNSNLSGRRRRRHVIIGTHYINKYQFHYYTIPIKEVYAPPDPKNHDFVILELMYAVSYEWGKLGKFYLTAKSFNCTIGIRKSHQHCPWGAEGEGGRLLEEYSFIILHPH